MIAACSLLAIGWGPGLRPVGAQQTRPDEDLATLAAEIETLKRQLPSQSHTMADVEFHFANLWFAARNGNWPLATFYLNETRSHLNWTVRMRPVRRLANGELDLQPILEGIETGALADLKTVVDGKDAAHFEGAYRAMMGQCLACHQAAEKPFLEPHIPEFPPSPMINSNIEH
jgi:hypothetical protein